MTDTNSEFDILDQLRDCIASADLLTLVRNQSIELISPNSVSRLAWRLERDLRAVYAEIRDTETALEAPPGAQVVHSID